MSRPARRQVAKDKVIGPHPSARDKQQSGQTYNIYYDRWSGGDSRSQGLNSKSKAQYRCDPIKDSGTTKGTYNPNAYFCAFFAKGCCPHGEDCAWLHRLPTRQDHVESGLDVFGRERYEEHREDRGGVGSMLSDTKTLYVGKIHISPDMQAIVEKHFKAWGEIERIKILKDKGVAFVTYQSRLNAEFAKVAMTDQSLDHGEILNIRWATEDPNPRSQAIAKRKAVEMAREAIESKISGDYKQAQHLPGSEEAIIEQSEKRQRYDTNLKETQQSQPTLYIGADGLYYYDYGDYGYNFETQQYDPGRLSHSQEHNKNSIQQSQLQEESKVPSLQERIKASLLTSANAAPNPSLAISAKDKKPVPVKSALSALAGYSSDSESGSES